MPSRTMSSKGAERSRCSRAAHRRTYASLLTREWRRATLWRHTSQNGARLASPLSLLRGRSWDSGAARGGCAASPPEGRESMTAAATATQGPNTYGPVHRRRFRLARPRLSFCHWGSRKTPRPRQLDYRAPFRSARMWTSSSRRKLASRSSGRARLGSRWATREASHSGSESER